MNNKNRTINAKQWFISFIVIILCVILLIAGMVVVIDPFFHYHKPLKGLYYNLNNERYQNDGITRHFDFDAMITGTSMTENFRASQADQLWGDNFAKICYSGAMYKELDDNLELAFENHDLKVVVRAIDGTYLLEDKDASRTDLGVYPDYLYDDNVFNDIRYLLNSSVVSKYCIPMLGKKILGYPGGVTSFDDYGRWQEGAQFGTEVIFGYRTEYKIPENEITGLTEDEINTLTESVKQNITDTAAAHPDTQFYYFFPPYSAAYWAGCWEKGTLIRDIECYRLAASLILPYDNIHLFAFDDMTEVTGDLMNYQDALHYGADVSDRILTMMHDDTGRLSLDTYNEFYDRMTEYYSGYDFNTLFGQIQRMGA